VTQLKQAKQSKLPAILVDEDRISQVLLNLIGNALQYLEEQAENEGIASGLRQEARAIRFSFH
jgi:signal transduction histidine kinase